MGFRYMRPDELMTLNGSIVATAETSYQAAWIGDGRPGFPFKGVSSSLSAVVVGSTKNVSGFVLGHHNVYAPNSITISGIASMVAPPIQANSINLNPWVSCATTSINSFTLAITNNSAGKLIIGELFAGTLRSTTTGLIQKSVTFDYEAGFIDLDAEFDGQSGYDKGFERRFLTGVLRCNSTDQAAIEAWWKSTRGTSLPSVIIPDDAVQDAWVVKFEGFQKRPVSYRHAEIAVRFREYSRSRW
jgi:hypothetical protein